MSSQYICAMAAFPCTGGGVVVKCGIRRDRKMMWIVLLVCIIVICVLYGRGILGILYWRHQPEEFVLADCLVAGLTVVIGLAETAHLCAVFLKISFSRCGILFGGMCILGLYLESSGLL